jgi:electron transfer flavoprotein beta subunit
MKEFRIVVCIKQVSDPEGPDSAFEIDSGARLVTPVGIPPVINPFDERALEAALQLKDALGARVVAMNIVDEKLAMPVLKKALAAGADELIILKDQRFVALDSLSKAYVLSAAIRQMGGCSLILAGRQAADWGFGQVGPILAEILKIPSISVAQRVTVREGNVIVERLKRTGYEILRAPLPVLVVMDSEVELRLASLKDIKDANSKPVTTWTASDLGIDADRLDTRRVYRLSKPPSRNRACHIVDGQTLQEKGENLAIKLRSDGVI